MVRRRAWRTWKSRRYCRIGYGCRVPVADDDVGLDVDRHRQRAEDDGPAAAERADDLVGRLVEQDVIDRRELDVDDALEDHRVVVAERRAARRGLARGGGRLGAGSGGAGHVGGPLRR